MDMTMTNTPIDNFTCCFDMIHIPPGSLFEISSAGNAYSGMHYHDINYHTICVSDCLTQFDNTFQTISLLPKSDHMTL